MGDIVSSFLSIMWEYLTIYAIFSFMRRTYAKDLKEKVGEEITICGWVDARRDHGKLVFADIRDMSGKVQAVILPTRTEAHTIAQTLRSEWVVQVSGKVNNRPEKMVNLKEPNGSMEPFGSLRLTIFSGRLLTLPETWTTHSLRSVWAMV